MRLVQDVMHPSQRVSGGLVLFDCQFETTEAALRAVPVRSRADNEREIYSLGRIWGVRKIRCANVEQVRAFGESEGATGEVSCCRMQANRVVKGGVLLPPLTGGRIRARAEGVVPRRWIYNT